MARSLAEDLLPPMPAVASEAALVDDLRRELVHVSGGALHIHADDNPPYARSLVLSDREGDDIAETALHVSDHLSDLRRLWAAWVAGLRTDTRRAI